MISTSSRPPRRFEFGRDTFAYANELVWDYELSDTSPAMITRRSPTPRTYTHRCFTMARSARQFFHHARFDAALPPVDKAAYAKLVRTVVACNPRALDRPGGPIVIPGYDSLHSFSLAQAAVLMANCGSMWRNYFLRSHWRMILPVPRRHQQIIVGQLVRSLAIRGSVIVHLFRFPQLTINHAILLYDQVTTPAGVKFSVYDPNLPLQPAELSYQAADRTFHFPRNHYWAGGRVDVMETFCSRFY
jgi:hypothetical protein